MLTFPLADGKPGRPFEIKQSPGKRLGVFAALAEVASGNQDLGAIQLRII
jgi:hypothetical protein